jgi:hypothetical protein
VPAYLEAFRLERLRDSHTLNATALPIGKVVAVPERGLKSRVVSKHSKDDFQIGSLLGRWLRKALRRVPQLRHVLSGDYFKQVEEAFQNGP